MNISKVRKQAAARAVSYRQRKAQAGKQSVLLWLSPSAHERLTSHLSSDLPTLSAIVEHLVK